VYGQQHRNRSEEVIHVSALRTQINQKIKTSEMSQGFDGDCEI
jgi:hypothetical protein